MDLQTKSKMDAGPTLQRWGAIASFLMAAALIIAAWIYLTGNINTAPGVIGYSVADLLFGPVFGAGLVTVVTALRERMGAHAPRRMQMAQLVAVLAAGAFVFMACIRAANRQYHLIHPELHLEESSTVLMVWTTLVAGVNGAAWHFLGWIYLLVGWSGWTSRQLPRVLSGLYVLGSVAALFVYQWPDTMEPHAGFLSLVVSIWLGIILLRGSKSNTS